MTDLAPPSHHADFQHGPQPSQAYPVAPHSPSATNGALSPPAENAAAEEIRCFCGFNDDDGSTVFCELCATWQHVQCYYPNGVVPEIHECASCKPRPLDERSASERQRQLRLQATMGKQRRVPGKSHKKKAKDVSLFAVQTNGFAAPDSADGERNTSGSPRDYPQPPPAKRPKTSHRPSSSTSALVHPSLPPNRRRAGSATVSGQSPTKSPHSPSPNNAAYQGDYYSPEFMRLQQMPDFVSIQNNSYASIAVSNDLRTWLNDVDSLRAVTRGLTQHSVFNRWDKSHEELEATSPGFTLHRERDASLKVHGEHPIMQWLTANTATAFNTYIGEIKGHIGRLQDYQEDPANRWDELNHPEPYVFFHDKLPLYIDCRQEGTQLRYVRRSCRANLKMQIIIRGTDFHFCLVSMHDIAEGEELTIPWRFGAREMDVLLALNEGSALSRESEAHMAHWVTTILANSGGCACVGKGGVCALDRFDLRRNPHQPATNGHTLKPMKARKSKKGTSHISPLSTGRATNSRATSEAVLHGDVDEDMADSRSVSNSSRSKPSSRDITPMGNVSDGATGLGFGMSERERRKLEQQERLFEKMESNENGSGRKKRNSAGSALNTPSLSTSKQLGFPDSQNPSPTSLSGAAKQSRTNGQAATSSRATTNGTPCTIRSRPVYTDTAVQTEPDKEEAPTVLTLRRQAQGSYAKRLLRRVHEESRRRSERSISVTTPEQTPATTPTKLEPGGTPEAVAMPPPPLPSGVPGGTQTSPTGESTTSPTLAEEGKDVEMKDADDAVETSLTLTPNIEKKEQALDTTTILPAEAGTLLQQPSHPPIQPPAPPWPLDSSSSGEIITVKSKSKSPMEARHPARDLHVTLPPVPAFLNSISNAHTPSTPNHPQTPGSATSLLLAQDGKTPTTPFAASSSADTPGPANPSLSITGTPMKKSPPSLTVNPPLFSPSVLATVAPSPMKKKMSLSDYTSRKKKTLGLGVQQTPQTSSPEAKGSDSRLGSIGESTTSEGKEGGEKENIKEDGEGKGGISSSPVEIEGKRTESPPPLIVSTSGPDVDMDTSAAAPTEPVVVDAETNADGADEAKAEVPVDSASGS